MTYAGHVQPATVARISPSGYYAASADIAGTGARPFIYDYLAVELLTAVCAGARSADLGRRWHGPNTQSRVQGARGQTQGPRVGRREQAHCCRWRRAPEVCAIILLLREEEVLWLTRSGSRAGMLMRSWSTLARQRARSVDTRSRLTQLQFAPRYALAICKTGRGSVC